MLESNTAIKQYGDSVVVNIPPTIHSDSNFPFELKKIMRNGKEIVQPLDVKIVIDTAKKRLVIEKIR